MTYRTCVGCRFEYGACTERAKVRAHVAGLGVTSIKWRCRWRQPMFQPGDAVTVRLPYAFEYDEEPLFAAFPGIIITAKRPTTPVVYVAPGTPGVADDDDDPDAVFHPRNAGNRGFCKVRRAHITRRQAIREHVCAHCQQPTRLLGHEDYCREASP